MERHYLDYPEHKVRYDISRRQVRGFMARAVTNNLASYDELDDAVAVTGNLDRHFGDELFIEESDETSGDSCVVFAAEWHDDVLGGRYLN